jgi:hypothetical protein
MSLRLSLICVTALGIAGVAHAMNMRTHFTQLALSDDGRSIFVRADISGPEGGGTHDYEIWSAAAPHRVRVTVSSDLSQGGGEHPETITAATCAQNLKGLEAELKKRGFKGVTVHTDRCAKRNALVTVDDKTTKELGAARFRAKGNKLVHEDLEVRFRSTEIGIYKAETKLCTLEQAKREAPAEIMVGGGKGGQLVYVIETTSSGDQGLVGLCGVIDGKLQPLPTTATK